MIERVLFAFLSLFVGALVSVSSHLGPPTDERGTDTDPVAKLRTLTQPLPEGEEPSGTDSFTDADFATHVEQLKKKLPSEDFTIVVQKPFVVIGDEPADVVKEHS